MTERQFLVVRLGSLGDIVHTFPAVAALRASFAEARIVWLTHPRWVELVKSSGLASEIWAVDSRDLGSVRGVIGRLRGECKESTGPSGLRASPSELRTSPSGLRAGPSELRASTSGCATGWGAAIDYQGLWKSAFLPFFGGVKRRVGFSSATIREFGVPVLYTDRVVCRTTHIAEQNGELSLRAGAKTGVAEFALQVCAKEAARVRDDLRRDGIEKYVVLSPGGGWRAKCWPAERFGELCQRIREGLGLRCVVNYGPGEEALGGEVLRACGNAQAVLYDGEMGALMALLRGAECIVGGDTGPLHLGVALGARYVALFGPTDPARNGPFENLDGEANDENLVEMGSRVAGPLRRGIVLRAAGAGTSHRRLDVTDPSLLELSVEDVFAAVKRCLGAA
jgi:heptosyltransferase I